MQNNLILKLLQLLLYACACLDFQDFIKALDQFIESQPVRKEAKQFAKEEKRNR